MLDVSWGSLSGGKGHGWVQGQTEKEASPSCGRAMDFNRVARTAVLQGYTTHTAQDCGLDNEWQTERGKIERCVAKGTFTVERLASSWEVMGVGFRSTK